MADYTPTTGAVRVRYIKSEPGYDPPLIPSDPDYEETGAEFDRWLAAHDRQVKAEAWDEGYDRGFYDREQLTGDSRDASEGASSNPYRTTEGED